MPGATNTLTLTGGFGTAGAGATIYNGTGTNSLGNVTVANTDGQSATANVAFIYAAPNSTLNLTGTFTQGHEHQQPKHHHNSQSVSIIGTGQLSLGNATALSDTGTLNLASGTTFTLGAAAGTSETIGALILNNVTEPAGTYTLAQLTAFNSGVTFALTNGETLTVVNAVPEPSTYACVFIVLAGAGLYARRRARREA